MKKDYFHLCSLYSKQIWLHLLSGHFPVKYIFAVKCTSPNKGLETIVFTSIDFKRSYSERGSRRSRCRKSSLFRIATIRTQQPKFPLTQSKPSDDNMNAVNKLPEESQHSGNIGNQLLLILLQFSNHMLCFIYSNDGCYW